MQQLGDDNTYTCDDAEDCWEKCPEPKFDGGSTGCDCIEGKVGWWCKVTDHLPGEGPGEVGGSGCGGGGGNPGGGGPMTKCASPPVVINCTGGRTERGDPVSCTADTEMDTISGVRYTWTAKMEGVEGENSYAGEGSAFQT